MWCLSKTDFRSFSNQFHTVSSQEEGHSVGSNIQTVLSEGTPLRTTIQRSHHINLPPHSRQGQPSPWLICSKIKVWVFPRLRLQHCYWSRHTKLATYLGEQSLEQLLPGIMSSLAVRQWRFHSLLILLSPTTVWFRTKYKTNQSLLKRLSDQSCLRKHHPKTITICDQPLIKTGGGL